LGETVKRAVTPPGTGAVEAAQIQEQQQAQQLQSGTSPLLPPDPNLQAEQNQAHANLIDSLQLQTQGDMAALLSRYGSRLALSGSSISPLTGR